MKNQDLLSLPLDEHLQIAVDEVQNEKVAEVFGPEQRNVQLVHEHAQGSIATNQLFIFNEYTTSQSQISPDNSITSPGTPTGMRNEGNEEDITPNPHASAIQTEIERESNNLENPVENSQRADEGIPLKSDGDVEDHSGIEPTEIYVQNYFNSLNNILLDQHQATCPENGICLGFTAMTSIFLLGLYAMGIFGDSHSEL